MVCYLLCFLFVLLIVVSFGGVGYEIVQGIKGESSDLGGPVVPCLSLVCERKRPVCSGCSLVVGVPLSLGLSHV